MQNVCKSRGLNPVRRIPLTEYPHYQPLGIYAQRKKLSTDTRKSCNVDFQAVKVIKGGIDQANC